MKKIFLFFIYAAVYAATSNAQPAPDSVLENRLRSKQNFYDIRRTVLAYFDEKLSRVALSDSVSIKKVNRQLKMWNRKLWQMEYYTDRNGVVQDANQVNYAALQQSAQINHSNRPMAQTQNWILQGPYNCDKGIGRFDEIAFHPTDANTIFAGSPYGGLFKTSNGGSNWYPVSAYMPSLGVAGIAIHPVDPNIIYVLSGDANGGNPYTSSSLGVFKTYDGGANWFRTGLLTSLPFQAAELIMDPSNPEILLAATTLGIFRTTDGGNTWTLSAGGNFTDIKFKPGNSSTVYAAGPNFFMVSANNGVSFSNIGINGIAGANRIAIGVTPANPQKVVLLAGPVLTGGNSFQGIYISTNSGQGFSLATQTPNIFYSYTGNAATNDQSGYDIAICISPVNENEIYAGGLSAWKSTNGGFGWSQVSAYWPTDDPYMHPDIHDIKINPLNNSVYCANDGGMYYYTGSSWTPLFNGATTTQFYHFERENDEGDIWGGAQDNGILEQDGGGGNYYIYATGDGFDEMTDHESLVADGESDDIYFSVNQKVKKDVFGGIADITPPGSNGFFPNLAMSPDLEDKIFAGYSNATFISFDAGDNWSSLGNVAGNWALSTCPSNTDVLYAAGANSINRFNWGVGWTNITPGLTAAGYSSNLKIADIDVYPYNHNFLYIAVAGTSANAKVFFTPDGGANWQNWTYNLPNVPVYSIKRDAADGLYAGTSIGVFYKRNAVNYWEPFSNGLPPVPVTEIELWPVSNEVWICTFGRGIWYTTQYNSCQADITLSGGINGNYYQEASNSISSTQVIYGAEGTSVKYNAGGQIRLTPGFQAAWGSTFRTYTAGCGAPINLSQRKNTTAKKTVPATKKKRHAPTNKANGELNR